MFCGRGRGLWDAGCSKEGQETYFQSQCRRPGDGKEAESSNTTLQQRLIAYRGRGTYRIPTYNTIRGIGRGRHTWKISGFGTPPTSSFNNSPTSTGGFGPKVIENTVAAGYETDCDCLIEEQCDTCEEINDPYQADIDDCQMWAKFQRHLKKE